jgi:hypothetical protein
LPGEVKPRKKPAAPASDASKARADGMSQINHGKLA